ncbi:pyridoxal phosphate-dependent aminotransferase [Bifidobacterium dolichotidis]|nr:aminotransferase class I/II-fold pyridoxal phosphate-dependent enzyme [Bifidobacterium dolichotidis]
MQQSPSQHPQLSQRAQIVKPFHGMRIGERAAELKREGRSIIDLSLGQPDFGAPASVEQAMRALYDGRPLPYTSAAGLPALRERISEHYLKKHGVSVDPARIIITEGGSAALMLATALTVDHGDGVLIADPSYPANRQLVHVFGGHIIDVPTNASTRFHMNAELVDQYADETAKVVMITSPSNPTGTTMSAQTLRETCQQAAAKGLWRIVDETYIDLADCEPDGSAVRTALAYDPDAIICNSFSKSFGMTGWRLGWIVVPEFALEAVHDLATSFFLAAHTPTQVAALAAFEPESQQILEQRRLELLERQAIVVQGLADIGMPLEVEPNGAFYAYCSVEHTGLTAEEFCKRALDEVGVALTPGIDFGQITAKTHVRMSYAASREDLYEGITRLGQFVQSLHKAKQ